MGRLSQILPVFPGVKNQSEEIDRSEIVLSKVKRYVFKECYSNPCLAKQFSFEHLTSSSSMCRDLTPSEDICHGAYLSSLNYNTGLFKQFSSGKKAGCLHLQDMNRVL